jgi:hypothetical protein
LNFSLLLYLVCNFFCINFTSNVFLSLFLPLSSFPLSCATIQCSSSHLLFLSLLIHSLPIFACPPTLPQTVTTLLFPLHTHNFLTTHTSNCPQSPAIPDTSTLHNNSRNIP